MREKRNGFTLIELIAVLVILAVIALIATPLVLNIVKKSKVSADKRSVDAYGKAVELAVTTYLLDNGRYPENLDNLTVEYSGNEVLCNEKRITANGSVYLSGCSVNGKEVKDSKTEDGYYHYGKIKEYKIGDLVTYKKMNFYVLKEANEMSDSLLLLKAEPLTVDEVNKYGIDKNGVNHVNKYTNYSVGTAYDENGYGGMVYYSSPTCGIGDSGCTNDYDESDIKYVVDNWANDTFKSDALVEDEFGYKARLIKFEELVCNSYSCSYEDIYKFLDNGENNYVYWTMSPYEDSAHVIVLRSSGSWYRPNMTHGNASIVVRPVINIKQSELLKNNS